MLLLAEADLSSSYYGQFVIPLLLLALSGIGGLVMIQINGIGSQLKALPHIEKELAGIQVTVNNHTTTLADTSKRLRVVEEHVSNTKVVALIKQRLISAEKEIRSLRAFRHLSETQLGTIGNLTELCGKLDDAIKEISKKATEYVIKFDEAVKKIDGKVENMANAKA